MRTHTIICLSLLLIAGSAGAQKLDLQAAAGMQGLNYKLTNGSSRLGVGGGLGVGYSYPLNNQWQLLSAASAELFNTRATLKDGAVFSSYQVDESGSAFQYNVITRGYEETQRFFALAIPVKLQYTHQGKTAWYANGGLRFVLPFKANLRASANELMVSGYYPDHNIEVKDLPQHGFGTFQNWQGSNKQTLNPTVALSGAAGFSFPLSDGLRLHTGLFIDYGLTNMRTREQQNGSLVTYAPGKTNTPQALGAMNISSRASLVAYGLQFKISWQ